MITVLKKTVTLKTNLLTILIVLFVGVIAVCLLVNNGAWNLMFGLLTPKQIESVTVYDPSGDRQAALTPEDAEALAYLLRKVQLEGASVRLLSAEDFSPQFRVRLTGGITFTIACYEDCYIVNGRGYYAGDKAAEDADHINYQTIARLYDAHLQNREYFPREAREG